jgi:glucans biosynthesis protein C
MNNENKNDDRYHALDNLRALMMWLGIVLHVAVAYITIPIHLPWRDDRQTFTADVIFGGIHAFRMPVFFVIAGFLALMLLEKRGVQAFVRHRLMRLGLPFAIFWPILGFLSLLAGVLFLTRIHEGRWGLEMSLRPRGQAPSMLHLWFLWMLLWFCLATALLSLLPRRPFALVGAWLAGLGKAWWGFAVLMLPLLLANYSYPRGVIYPSGELLPPWNEWLHSGLFFAFGLALYAHRAALLPHFERHWRRYAVAALVLFLLAGSAQRRLLPIWQFSAIYQACTWLATFAWIGFGVHAMGSRNALMAYLADSAYWVYLAHLPLTLLFAALLYQAPLFAEVKMLIGIVATTVVCLGSYELFVRRTWVSVLLNGKRHPPRGGTTLAQAA